MPLSPATAETTLVPCALSELSAKIGQRDAPAMHVPRFYRPELDGLRALAFFLVFCSHCIYETEGWSWLGTPLLHIMAGGMFGVDLFFVLSAYLITELFRREEALTASIDIRGFYMRRILRIWPLYFGCVLFWFLVRKFVPPPEIFPVSALLAFLSLSGNWYMAVFVEHAPFHSPVSPLWSVSVEEQFYCIWPVVVRFANRQGIIAVACTLFSASFAIQALLFRSGTMFLSIWFNSLVHGGAISVGILFATLFQGHAPSLNANQRRGLFLAALLLLGLAHSTLHLTIEGRAASPYLGILGCGTGLLAVTLLFCSALGSPGHGLQFLQAPVLTYLGRISYGLYVFHYAVLNTIKYLFVRYSGRCPSWTVFAITLPLTIALASLSYRWYEAPFLNLKHLFSHVESGSC